MIKLDCFCVSVKTVISTDNLRVVITNSEQLMYSKRQLVLSQKSIDFLRVGCVEWGGRTKFCPGVGLNGKGLPSLRRNIRFGIDTISIIPLHIYAEQV